MHREITANAQPLGYLLPRPSGVLELCILGSLPAFCLAAELSGLEAYLGFACLISAVTLFWGNSSRRFGVLTLVGIFSVAAAMHAVGGLILAGPTTDAIWGNTRVADFYPRAFLVIAAGLLAASIGFEFGLRWRMTRITGWCKGLAIDDSRLLRWTQLLTISGAVLIISVYYKVGYIPLLSSVPGQSRYLTGAVSSSFQRDEWIVNRGMDLLTYSLPLMIAWCLWKPGWRNISIVVAGGLALLLPLRRANFISIAIAVVIMQMLRTGKLKKRYLAIIALAAVLYGASQLLFFDLLDGEYDARDAISAMGSALPEVRDLGWMMSISNDKWYGLTFLQAVLPIPSISSDFSHNYSLRQISTRAIGLDEQDQTGGLRLTLSGESYSNFGYVGVAVVGFIFGIACALLDVAVSHLKKARGIAGVYFGTLLFIWLCFWLYLGGTQAAATIKVGFILAISTYLFSKQRRPAVVVTPSAVRQLNR